MDIRKSILGVLLAGALVGVAGCGASEDSGSPAPEPETSITTPADEAEETSEAPTEATTEESASEEPEAAAEEVTITITDFKYEISGPVAPGAEVTVINNDSAAHTVTSDEEGMFDSVFGPNETVTFTAPDEPGDYSFICTYHPAMVGTLVVEG
ncbi:cupredoxin domain-containing protein [Arthrobacter sp. TMN-50]